MSKRFLHGRVINSFLSKSGVRYLVALVPSIVLYVKCTIGYEPRFVNQNHVSNCNSRL